MSYFLSLASGRGKREKWMWKNSTGPINTLRFISARGRGAFNNERRWKNSGSLPLCLHLSDQKLQSVIRIQILDIWRIMGPYWACLLPQLVCISCCRYTCTTACHGTRGWGISIHCRVKSWNSPKLTTVYRLTLSLEEALYSRAPKIPQADYTSAIVVWVEGRLLMISDPSFQNPVLSWVFNIIEFWIKNLPDH